MKLAYSRIEYVAQLDINSICKLVSEVVNIIDVIPTNIHDNIQPILHTIRHRIFLKP